MSSYDDILNNTPDEAQAGAQFSKEEYAARKRAERDALYVLSDDTAQGVANDGGKFRQYLNLQSRFERYSAVNVLLILAQNPNATRLESFDYWKDKGASVKTGQTGISVLEAHEYTKEDGSPGIGYNAKKVFDASQIDMRKMKPEPAPPTYSDRQLLSALIHRAPVKITGVDVLPGDAATATNTENGEISVRRGMSFADNFRCLSRELAAAQIRDNPDTRIDPGFAAHCVSYILCKKYGVDEKQDDFKEAPDAFRYLDAQEMKSELSQIRDIFSDINYRMVRQLESLQKPVKNQEAR